MHLKGRAGKMIDYEKLFIFPEHSIKNAMNKLGETSEKILFVVSKKDKNLLGTVTDGDIRRWILKEGDLNDSVDKIMNKNPRIAAENDSMERIKELMLTHRVECIPQVDNKNRIVSVSTFEEILSDSEKPTVKEKIKAPVVIMAGGKGGRLKPFTDILPKPLIPIGDDPLIKKIMDIFNGFGMNDFHIILNYKAELIKAYFAEHTLPYNMNFLKEEKFLGTAGGLSLLKGKIKGSFFVTNCDIIVKTDYADLFKHHKAEGNSMTVVCSMKNFKIPYGVIYHGNNGVFKRMEEKPEMDFLINTGVYIMEPEVLKLIPDGVEYDINVLINELHKKNFKIGIYPVSDNLWFDMGQWEEYFSSLRIIEKGCSK
jgi:dTDP-glucose pyrophosphorylase/CBS domain-containing protein